MASEFVAVTYPKSPWGRQGKKGGSHLAGPGDPWISWCGLPVAGASKHVQLICTGCWILSGRAARYLELKAKATAEHNARMQAETPLPNV